MGGNLVGHFFSVQFSRVYVAIFFSVHCHERAFYFKSTFFFPHFISPPNFL